MVREWHELTPLRPLWDGDQVYAHTPNGHGCWHGFREHSIGVADQAFDFAAVFGGGDLARFLGYTHDAGKLTRIVQERLRLCHIDSLARLGATHKVEGAALGGLLNETSREMFQCAFLANFGHHHELPSSKEKFEEIEEVLEDNPDTLDPLVVLVEKLIGRSLSESARQVALPQYIDVGERESRERNRELFVRMVHSALVDADFLDTAAHFRGRTTVRRHVPVGLSALRDHFMRWYGERYHEAPNTELNRLRRTTFERCVDVALDPVLAGTRGVYRLPAPTGSGKTLAAAAFALNHAAEYGKRRVIVAVPYTSITTQNAQVYRTAFSGLGDEIVLEHHSNIDNTAIAESSWRRLSAENWDAEFIVTTTVQLFDSLFKGKPSASRKLHRIAGSVIVLDEIQSLPLKLLPTILTVLRQLIEQYDVTVLLASATQPAFWRLSPWGGDSMRGIMELPCYDIMPIDDVPRVARRVAYEIRGYKQSWPELADEIARERQALAIVNTTDHAQKLHTELAEVFSGCVLHLSTRMCAQHRSDVLDKVSRMLTEDRPVLLVSTQLIEAGVDVDFPVVYRALAPAESLIQSAGRCNREGQLGVRGGRVVVFESEEDGMPGGLYTHAAGLTRSLFVDEGRNLENPADLTAYFRTFYRDYAPMSVRDEIDVSRCRLDFPAVAKAFQMIDAPSMSAVITDYGEPQEREAVRHVLEGLEKDPRKILDRSERRLLQRFSATLPRSRGDAVLAIPVVTGILRWDGEYDASRGVVVEGGATIL